jgi:sulfur transfer complex TusBCD TusB component (DsrH family)
LKTLHILRKRRDVFAEAAVCSEASEGKARDVSVLLIQDAVLGSPAVPVTVYVNKQDLRARGVEGAHGAQKAPQGSPHIIVDDEQICQMIIGHDRTIVW